MKISFLPLIAPRTEPYWPATTDNTSTGMRLNSSKQPHAPVCASPEKMFAITLYVIWSEQFCTITQIARPRPRSFVVSVFPVPAGPAGAPPSTRRSAWVSVM